MHIKQSLSPAILLLLLASCTTLHLYPVKGPLADQKSVSVVTAKATGWYTELYAKTISFSLPTGETCEGPWKLIPRGQVDNELSSIWDSIYGAGYYVANVLGSTWHGTAIITGSKGTIFHLEFYRDTVKGSPLLGVAKDDSGNVYKVAQ